jgi:phosphate transport system substrate-binding protein
VTFHRWLTAIVFVVATVSGPVACGGSGDQGSSAAAGDLSGAIRIDGSVILAPLSEAIAREFESANNGAYVTVGAGGTGSGFELLCAGKVDLVDAAWLFDERVVKLCGQAGIGHEPLHVAAEALAVVVNRENPVDCLDVTQLNLIWSTDAIDKWDEVPGLKRRFDREMTLVGPSRSSGLSDYFAEAVHGVAGALRADYRDVGGDEGAVIDDVASAPGGMGFVNFSTYAENEDRVKALEVDDGKGCVAPAVQTIQDGSYAPLGRPMFLYLSDAGLKQSQVGAFVAYYLENVVETAESLGFVPLTEDQLKQSEAAAKRFGVP